MQQRDQGEKNLQWERRLPERGWFSRYLARRRAARQVVSCSVGALPPDPLARPISPAAACPCRKTSTKPSSKNLPQLLNDKIDVVETQSCGLGSTGVVIWFLFWIHASQVFCDFIFLSFFVFK